MYDNTSYISSFHEVTEVLSASEDQSCRLFESVTHGILILDAFNRRIIDVNPSFCKISGYERQEILDKNLQEISLFENDSEIYSALLKLSKKGHIFCKEIFLKTKAGDLRALELTGNTYTESEQLFIQIIIREIPVLEPVIEIREQELRNTAILAQIAGKVARLGGWAIELPERRLIWSDENCEIHEVPPGYVPTLEEGIGLYPEEYQDEVRRCVEECEKNGTPYDFELPKYTKKGRLIWVRSIGEAVRDSEGKIVGLQGAFQDITERKRAEQEMRENREQYKQMVEYASDIICKTDTGGHFTFINPAISKILKYSEQELLSRHFLYLVHPDFRRKVKKFYVQQLLRKIPDTYQEFIARAKDGTEVWIGQHTQLLYRNDQVSGFQAICRDITEKKRTEEQLLHLSLVDELTGLYNLRGFMSLAEHQMKLAQNKRIEAKMFVIYIDLDGLKEINDTYGHDEGSLAIIDTAKILKRSFRHSDLIGRLGGDEFVVLAVEAEEENAEMIISRLQKNFDDHNARRNSKYKISFSFGLARFESESEFQIENLISKADKEMYKQKNLKRIYEESL